jgi:hypothetical protein
MDSVRLLLVAGVGGGSDCLPTAYLNIKWMLKKIKTQKSWDIVPLIVKDFMVHACEKKFFQNWRKKCCIRKLVTYRDFHLFARVRAVLYSPYCMYMYMIYTGLPLSDTFRSWMAPSGCLPLLPRRLRPLAACLRHIDYFKTQKSNDTGLLIIIKLRICCGLRETDWFSNRFILALYVRFNWLIIYNH